MGIAKNGSVTVNEDYELAKSEGGTKLMLITIAKPELAAKGVVKIGNRRIEYNANQLDVAVEPISDKLDPLLQGIWGKTMYRIVMTVKGNPGKGKIRYRIS